MQYKLPVSIIALDHGELSYPKGKFYPVVGEADFKKSKRKFKVRGRWQWTMLTAGKYHNQLYIAFRSAIENICVKATVDYLSKSTCPDSSHCEQANVKDEENPPDNNFKRNKK